MDRKQWALAVAAIAMSSLALIPLAKRWGWSVRLAAAVVGVFIAGSLVWLMRVTWGPVAYDATALIPMIGTFAVTAWLALVAGDHVVNRVKEEHTRAIEKKDEEAQNAKNDHVKATERKDAVLAEKERDINAKDRLITEREATLASKGAEHSAIVAGKSSEITARDSAIAEKEAQRKLAISEKDSAIAAKEAEHKLVVATKDGIIATREATIAGKDNLLAGRDSVIASGNAEHRAIIAKKDAERTAERFAEEAQRQAIERELATTRERIVILEADRAKAKQDKDDALGAQRIEHEATMVVAQAECEKRIADTIRRLDEIEKQRELKDCLIVSPLVVPANGHVAIYNGLQVPNRKVTVRFALMVSNVGRRGAALRELHDMTLVLKWDGEVFSASGGVHLDDRIVKGFPYINVGGYQQFYEFEPIEVPTQHSPPHPWAQSGTLELSGKLMVAAASFLDDPNHVLGAMPFFITTPITFVLAAESDARFAAATVMTALANQTIDRDVFNTNLQAFLTNIRGNK